MLQSYEAQLRGNQVTWLGSPPSGLDQIQHVLVVLEAPATAPTTPRRTASEVLQRARGSLAAGDRESVLATLAQMRQEWDR
jgi:hypothetical protein